MSPGTSVTLTLIHDGQSRNVTLTLGTLPNEKQASNEPAHPKDQSADIDVPKLGFTLAPANKVAGSNSKGVVVTAISDGGVAADHGLQVGDVILDVGGKAVATPAEVNDSVAEARKQGKHTVLFRVKSGEGTKYVALPLGNA
jgi:serine protease Do